jgi:transposase
VISKLNSYQHRLQYAELKIQVLEERLRLKRTQMYAPGSEDRLRRERAVGCRAGEILRGRDQVRETRLQELRGAARLAPRIIEKSLVSDRMVVDTVVSKYADHCPLYRQSTMLERDSGVELSRQALDGWVMRVGELLAPLAEALRQELLLGSYLQADETPVGVQMHDGNGSNHLAYLWQYGQPHGAVVFDFRMGRGREGPKHFLGNFDGLLQSDGYAVYDSVGGPKMVHACCWSHARRKFVEAVKLHPQDVEVVRIEEIKAAVTAARATALPSSALGKAAN